MFLFHGTERDFESFSADAFGTRQGGDHNGHFGIWCSMTPVLPAAFGRHVLIIEVMSDSIVEVPNQAMVRMRDRVRREDIDPAVVYPRLSADLRAVGYDVVAIMENDDTVGNLVVLDPANVRIVGRIDASDIDALAAAEETYADRELMARRSRFVDSMVEARSERAMAMGA